MSKFCIGRIPLGSTIPDMLQLLQIFHSAARIASISSVTSMITVHFQQIDDNSGPLYVPSLLEDNRFLPASFTEFKLFRVSKAKFPVLIYGGITLFFKNIL